MSLGEEGIGCIVFSPLAQGMLTSKYLGGIPEDSRAAKESGFLQKDQITSEVVDKVKKLSWLAQDRGQTIAQMALMWCLRDIRVASVLVGARTVKQLEENIHALKNIDFTEEELQEIENILK